MGRMRMGDRLWKWLWMCNGDSDGMRCVKKDIGMKKLSVIIYYNEAQ